MSKEITSVINNQLTITLKRKCKRVFRFKQFQEVLDVDNKAAVHAVHVICYIFVIVCCFNVYVLKYRQRNKQK